MSNDDFCDGCGRVMPSAELHQAIVNGLLLCPTCDDARMARELEEEREERAQDAYERAEYSAWRAGL